MHRQKCGAGAVAASAAAAAAAAAARDRLAKLPAPDKLLGALSSRLSSFSGGGSRISGLGSGSSGSTGSPSCEGSSGQSQGGGSSGAAASEACGSEAGVAECGQEVQQLVLYAAFGGTPWAAKPRALAPSPPGSPFGSAPALGPVRWAVREEHLPY